MFISDAVSLNRSLLGEDNEKAIDLLSNYIPIKKYSILSGTKCFDWTVPQEWKLQKAILQDLNGNVILDANDNILHVVQHSKSVDEILVKSEFEKRLHYLEDLPDAIPYRTSYYDREWGFCLSYNQFKNLKDDQYRVIIKSEFVDSFMSVAECTLPGYKSDKEVILSSYFCHPNQANDGLSGVECLIRLYDQLKSYHRHYTYRLMFIPETIGSLYLLSHKIVEPHNVEYAIVPSCVGVGDDLHYKRTFNGHSIDNIVESMEISTYKFQPFGSDERQYSSPKIRIPTGLLMRSPYYEGTPDFAQYHTSEDNLELIDIDNIQDTADVLMKMIERYEKEPRYIVNHDGGEPFLSKYNLYRKVGTTGHNDWDKIRNWIIFYSDGENTISDIVSKTGYSRESVEDCLTTLIKNKVINECRHSGR